VLLADRNVLITGASRGIGRAVAREATSQGANVALVARDAAALTAVASELQATGRRCHAVAADVRNRADVKHAVQESIAVLGTIDGLVNCAGVGVGPVPVDEITDEQWTLILETNLTGPLLFVQELAPHFIERGKGAIVNVSSVAAKYKPGATSVAYAASKSALSGLTRQLALRLGGSGIRVNAVLPGNTVLEQPDRSWASLSEDDKRKMLREIALGRFGTPEDQARAVVWLLSDYNTWITGENIAVAGGERMG
jgi:NAD(P)-dependent dehydrogenase (short-subunit alcohol dehydrogenase family)